MSVNEDILRCLGHYLCERLSNHELTARPARTERRAVLLGSRHGQFEISVIADHLCVRRSLVWSGPGAPPDAFQPKVNVETVDYWERVPDGRFMLADPDLFELVLAHLRRQLVAEPEGRVVGH